MVTGPPISIQLFVLTNQLVAGVTPETVNSVAVISLTPGALP